MAYEAVVKRYLRELEGEYNSAVRGGQHTGELSYRAPMHEFFKALARELNPAGSFDIVLGSCESEGRTGASTTACP